MGYRSDVYIAVAFANEEDMKEVMAVYAMNENVQKFNLLERWTIKADNILYFEETGTKWYDNYEDVQGVEHMLSVADDFHSEREMPLAYRTIRIGEETNDIERREEHGYDASGVAQPLMEMLWDRMSIIREVEITL